MQQVNDQRFFRSHDRILGGVCAGLAEGFNIDPLWVRVAFIVLVFLQGVGVFLYIVLWLVMPERLEGGGQRSGFDAMMADVRRIWNEFQGQLGSSARPASSPPASSLAAVREASPDPARIAAATSTPRPYSVRPNQTLLIGVILVVVGLALLGGNIGIINWSIVWPAALITIGIVVLIRNFERKP